MKIAASQSDVEKIILRYVAQFKYFYWTSGTISGLQPEKLDRLSKKFAEAYGTLRAPHWKSYQARKGLARAFCVAYRLPNGSDYRWYLLATDGLGPIKQEQQLKDARHVPIEIGDLRLVQARRPSEDGGGRRWTYLIDRRAQSAHDKHLLQLVKEGNEKGVRDACRYIAGYSMHSGVRSWVRVQLRSKAALWAKIWTKRAWPGPDPEASLPILKLTKINFAENLAAGDRPGSPDQRHVN